MDQSQAVYSLASILLQYPSMEWKDYLDELYHEARQFTDPEVKGCFQRFIDYLERHDYETLCQSYVRTFDFNERSTLYLTYTVFKDNRDRGPALVKLRQEFLAAGAELESDELPDYLPLILEFAAITDTAKSAKILKLHFRAIERLALELEAMNSPYYLLLGAVVSSIRKLSETKPSGETGERRII